MESVSPVIQLNQPNNLRLIACPSLNLEHGRIDRYVPEGATVAGHLRELGWHPDGLHARVFIDGEFIEQARWEYAVPKAGQCVVTRVIPMGGGGESGGKTALRIVAMIAIVITSVLTAGATSAIGAPLVGAFGFGTAAGWAAAAGVAVSIAGTLAMSALVPAPLPRRPLPLPVQESLKVAA